ncbi:LysR family transcriptional regulator [Acidisoma cellulosilytica]|uniref:LysR family transcriptional regulator n=1 Tax=Acidisoma cellulosilyticum TaxID=2802395 RepID=A0A963Z5D7_9PROT|nr:LysR family transcriptional regulator [Acidisoma cellulosilyticum]MCB8882380.1 LysR family transcriptional regulator [Acidisoma cellulosilyticum]
MNLSGLSLDQFLVFVTVAETGSFSAAARQLNRAQSAVTYAIQKLEDQLGVSLFDRSAYRPSLTEAGAALLPRATRIISDVGAFSDQARGITEGLEPELAIVVDAMFPMDRIVDALRVFGVRYPTVPTRIFVASMGATANLVIDGTCAIGIALSFTSQGAELIEHEIETVRMVAVASQCHPLAAIEGPIPNDELQNYVQLVLTDPSGRTDKRDHGVLSRRNWRIGDLGAKHTMLLGGLGWGGMPLHMIQADVAAGRLQIIRPEEWGTRGGDAALSMCLIHRPDRALGPAARWLSDWLISGKRGPQRGDAGGYRALVDAAE